MESRSKLNRVKSGEVYYEKHHIIPKSLGGSNDAVNLLLLTAKEHFIAHLLLTKFTKGKDRHKMIFALDRMINGKQNTYYKINSTLYENIKKESSKIRKEFYLSKENTSLYRPGAFLGKKHSKETKEKMSKSKMGANNHMFGKIGSKNPLFGTKKEPLSDEVKNKISKKLRNRKFTQEHRKKLSKANKGRKLSKKSIEKMKVSLKKIVTCPHCGKEGGITAMSRWHFDNCKLKS